jgi:hypothetical protein
MYVQRNTVCETLPWTALNRSLAAEFKYDRLTTVKDLCSTRLLFNGLDCGIDIIPLKGLHHENRSQNGGRQRQNLFI